MQAFVAMKTQRRYSKSAALLLATLAALLLAGCAGMRPAAREAPLAQTRLTILFGNAGRGAFEPAGCGCRLRGGLARRAQFVQDARTAHPAVMLFDTGNLLFDKAEPEAGAAARIRADYMLAALARMGTDVMNVGPCDCSAGCDYVAAKAAELGLTLVSANITRGPGQGALFQPYVMKEFGEISIGIFGLAGHPERPGRHPGTIALESPVQKAEETLRQLKREGCQLVVLLSQLTLEENRLVAAQVPGIHFILGSSAPDQLPAPEVVGSTTILVPGAGGSSLGMLELDLANRADDFYDISVRAALEHSAQELESKQLSAADQAEARSLLQQQARIQEQRAALAFRNSFRYTVHGLDGSLSEDPAVQLLVQRYKEDLLKSRVPAYKESVTGIDLAGLSEAQRRMAMRLMNELACGESGSIADAAAADPRCNELAGMIVDRIRRGATEGEVRYAVLYASQQQKKVLDKGFRLH